MFKKHEITRRALLIGAGATMTAGALAASSIPSDGSDQPEAPAPFDLKTWLAGRTPAQRANYHQQELAMALCEMNPGHWRTEVTARQDFVLFVRAEPKELGAASVYVQYILEGARS